MEESSGDANSGECLHHFEVTGGGRACQSRSFKVNEKSGSRRRSRREEQARCNFGLAALTDRLTLRIRAPFYRCARERISPSARRSTAASFGTPLYSSSLLRAPIFESMIKILTEAICVVGRRILGLSYLARLPMAEESGRALCSASETSSSLS